MSRAHHVVTTDVLGCRGSGDSPSGWDFKVDTSVRTYSGRRVMSPTGASESGAG
jgi:hypothetical protein